MNYNTKQEQLQALCRPFPVEEVKSRDEGGKSLSYYEGATIMKRLTDVMGCGYSIATGRVERYLVDDKPRRIDMEVIVSLRWVDGSESRLTGWGSSDIQYSKKDEWRIVSDFMKTSATDGIKVALSKIGVGAELYDSAYRASLGAVKEEQEAASREKAVYTCMECQGEIIGGMIGGKDITREEVVSRTRSKFKRRYCIPCAIAASKAVA